MFLTGVVAAYTTTYAHELMRTFGSIYFWYDASLAGAFWGLLWGFLDAFLGTLLVALVYNAIGLHHHEPAGHPAPVGY
jgi:hypothetical protein